MTGARLEGRTDDPADHTIGAMRLANEVAAAPDDRVNILLVDDQPANVVALEAMLQGLGQNLITAGSGREALKLLLTHEFAVILLDVKMPDMDGFETATLIRQRDKSRHTPIIFLTAADKSQTQAVRGYAVGAVDYLVKPVVPEFVRSKVAVFVELAKKSEQLRRQTQLLQASELDARHLAEARAELLRDLEQAIVSTTPDATISTAPAKPASRCPGSSTTCSTWRATPGPICASRRWT
jgi:CheY-like chemotaxis protein